MTEKIDPAWEADEAQEPEVKALSRDEAQALMARQPRFSPWRVVAVQALAGLLAAVVAALFGWRNGWISALYGAAAVVVPGVLFARGMTKTRSGAGSALLGFALWELIKIAVAVLILALAAQAGRALHWPVLLVTMVLCLKVNGLILLWQGGRSKA